MSICPVCGQDKAGVCCCGYCWECIRRFGHEGCRELLEDRKKENDR